MSIAADRVEHEVNLSDELDVAAVRDAFPILNRKIGDRDLVYLDNAATTQKPRCVIESVCHYYEHYNANIHRGVHTLSQEATEAYERGRDKIRNFINARHRHEIIFTRGATEAINLVASSFGRSQLKRGDEILITAMEHHSNIVPWQLICEQTGAELKVAPMDQRGQLLLDEFEALISERTRLVAVVHLSNALGTVNPVDHITDCAHRNGVPVLLDGAQAVSHLPVDVQALDCDFYVFSGHKIFAPTGIGVLYGKETWLDEMPPYQGGGDMIKAVSFERTLYNDLPYKFEAGTPHISGGIGLGAAVDFLQGLQMDKIARHERALLDYAQARAAKVPGLRIIGTALRKASVFSFVLDGIHPHDIGTILDHEGIAIRAGHHCAMPVMEFFQVPATARASFALYNTRAEVDALFAALDKAVEMFA